MCRCNRAYCFRFETAKALRCYVHCICLDLAPAPAGLAFNLTRNPVDRHNKHTFCATRTSSADYSFQLRHPFRQLLVAVSCGNRFHEVAQTSLTKVSSKDSLRSFTLIVFLQVQQGLEEAVSKSRKQIKERKNRSKKVRGTKKAGGLFCPYLPLSLLTLPRSSVQCTASFWSLHIFAVY